MNCPKCGSNRIEKRPPSQITPNSGYICIKCGAVLRGHGTLPIYIAALAIGIAFFVVMAGMLISEPGELGAKIPQALGLAAMGIVCSGYSLMQLLRHVPTGNPDEHDPWNNDSK